MLPSSTSNESYDARRRRGAQRGVADATPPNDGSPDSSTERVATPKRRLIRNRKQQTGNKEANDVNDTVISSKSASLDEDNETAATQHQLPKSSSEDTDSTGKAGSLRHLNRKKLMSTSHHSTKSLDSAADMLEQERLEQLHSRSQSARQKSQSHHLVESTKLDASIAVTGTTSGSGGGTGTGSSSLRSSLSDFKKSMRRHINLPSKHNKSGSTSSTRPTTNQEVLSKSSSGARHNRTKVKAPTSDVTSSSGGHRRTRTTSNQGTQLNRRGSDTDLAAMSLRPDSESTEKSGKESSTKKQSRGSMGSSTAVGAASTGFIKKLWSSRQRMGGSGHGSSGRLSNSSSSSLLDHDDDAAKDDQGTRHNATAVAAAALPVSSSDARGGSDDETDNSSQSKRKSKRVELVRELLSRDSPRVRDRARAAGTLMSQMDVPVDKKASTGRPLPAQPLKSDLSTEEESPMSDSKQASSIPDEPIRDNHAAAGTDNQTGSKKMKPSSLNPKSQGSLSASSRHSHESLKSSSDHTTSSMKRKGGERRRSLGSDSRRREGGSHPSLVSPSSRRDGSKKKNPSGKESKAAKADDALQDSAGGRGTSRKSPKTPSKMKDILEGIASQRSLSVEDITTLDDSSKRFVDSSDKEVSSEEKKKKRRSRKKTERLSSSSSSWRASDGKTPRHSRSASDPYIGGNLVGSSGVMDLSVSSAEMEGSENLSRRGTAATRNRTEEKPRVKKGSATRKTPTRSRTEEKPLAKNASEMRKSGSSRSLGRSPKKPSGGVVDKSKAERDSMGEKPLQEDTFSSLDAIVNAPKGDIDLIEIDGPKARDSLDASLDVFHDSPDGSPLSNSVPILWGSSTESSALDRLVSSMPNLDFRNKSSELGKSVGGRDELTRSRDTSRVDDEGIFQDDSDESHSTQDFPNLKSMCDDEPHADVMTRIADQFEDRLATKSIQPRSSIDAILSGFKKPTPTRSDVKTERGDSEGIFKDDSDESHNTQDLPELEPMCEEPNTDVMTRMDDQVGERLAPQSLHPQSAMDANTPDFSACIPTRSPVAEAESESNRNVLSPRAARTVNSKGKLDRGPAIPRRSNSFDDDDNESLETSTEKETTGADGEDISVHPVNVSSSMQFDRTADNGWVQTPLGSSTTSNMSETSAEHSSAGTLPFPDGFEASPIAPPTAPPTALVLRRRASMGDLNTSSVSENRWGATSSSDTVPIVSRQSYPSITDRASHSMGAAELRNVLSLPKRAGAKQLERTYLPVSLQSAARKRMPRARSEASNAGDSASRTGRDARTGGIAVDTGLSDMFQMAGELVEDLVKFENQVAFLRAQRARRMEEDSTEEDSTED